MRFRFLDQVLRKKARGRKRVGERRAWEERRREFQTPERQLQLMSRSMFVRRSRAMTGRNAKDGWKVSFVFGPGYRRGEVGAH